MGVLFYKGDNSVPCPVGQIIFHLPKRSYQIEDTVVYLNKKNENIPTGVQQRDRGIQRGLVRITKNKSPNPNPMMSNSKLDCRKISKRTINEKSMNLSKILA